MFTEADIRKETAEQTFQRGRQLYQSGNVQNIQVQDAYIRDKRYKKIKAFVQGSGWKCYNVDIMLNEEERYLGSYKCECPAAKEYAGLCKHAVGTLLRYIHVRDDQEKKRQNPVKKITVEFPDRSKLREIEEKYGLKRGAEFYGKNIEKTKPVKKEVNIPKTELELYRILMGNGLEQQLSYRQQAIRGKVRLEPVLHDNFGKVTVEFKIGITHMYVLKNVMEFEELMRRKESKRYGAKLDFYHHISAFDKDSVPVVKFLMEIANDFRTRGGINVYQYYTTNDVKREIPMAGSHLDHFFEVMKDRTFEVETALFEKDFYQIEDGEPKMPLAIQGTAAGIRLVARKYEMAKGSTYQYIYDSAQKKIYRVPLDSITKILPFREYMNKQAGKSVFIAERELPIFCRDLLPELSKHYELEISEFSPEKYLPEEVSFEIYLDMPEYDTITCKLTAVYGEEKYNVTGMSGLDEAEGGYGITRHITGAQDVVIEKRNVQKELEIDSAVGSFFPQYDLLLKSRILSGNGDTIYDFLTEGMDSLQELGEVYISEKMKKVQIMKKPAFSMGVSLKSGLLELNLESGEMPLDQLAEILAKYDRRKKYYRLKNGSFINMQDEEMSNVISLVDGLQLTQSQLKKGEIVIPKYRALYLDSLSREEGITYLHKDKDFRQLVRNMKAVEDSDYEVPKSLKMIMREYQKNGYQWLRTLHDNGFGGILADDMGLGKTLQVISFLLAEYEEKKAGRTLIVCPASLVYNWLSELERFAPSLHTVMITGDVATRKELITNSTNEDILITSYDLLKRDIEHYQQLDFFCEIIDEAQFIKNQNTQAAKSVKMITAATKFALTGTPMENRLSELWSIFDYLMPGFLFGYKQFKENVEEPIVERQDEAAMLQLRRFITPFILRRLKKDVLKDLPDKLEEVVYAKMPAEQQELYDASVQKMKLQLAKQTDEEFRENKLQLLAELTRLRQICCNPLLLYENYEGAAAKVEVCMELLQNAIEGGHKVLLFSQFTSMLELLAKEAGKNGISFYKLTGQTSKEDRIRMVERFNKDDTQVFLISLKAGGTGLNLTSADIVIHFDPWWNVAAQNQATDRTHRIGQKNVVTVYKLIAKGTIEEKIVKLQEMKQELADQVLSGENMDKTTLSKEELLELLGGE